MALSSVGTVRNRILSALPRAALDDLLLHLYPVSQSQRQILHEAGAPIRQLYFVEQGLASVLTTLTNGDAIEVRMIGREGVTGFPYLLGAEILPQQIIVQVPGNALRISSELLKTEFDRREALRHNVLRFVNAANAMTSQTAACNRLHSVEQRCARWLLNASDRVCAGTMPITHEFLSLLLCVRRSGVTVTAGRLQHSGLISYHRGHLTILNREALEPFACECYRIDREQLEWDQPNRRADEQF